MYREFSKILKQQCSNLKSMTGILLSLKTSKSVKVTLKNLHSVAAYLDSIFPEGTVVVPTLGIYKELDSDIALLTSPRVVVEAVPEMDLFLYEDLVRSALDIAGFIRRGLLTLKQFSESPKLPSDAWRYLYEIVSWVILVLEWMVSGRMPAKLSLTAPKIMKALNGRTSTPSEDPGRVAEPAIGATPESSKPGRKRKASTKKEASVKAKRERRTVDRDSDKSKPTKKRTRRSSKKAAQQ
jgi:hypothetical protein